MNTRHLWILILIFGIVPLILPFATGLYNIWLSPHSWTMTDWLIMYSFVYWPSYLIGAILMIIALILRHRSK